MTSLFSGSDKSPDFSALQAATADPAPAPRRGPGRPSKSSTRATLERKLTEQFGAIGMTVCVFDPYCGQSVIMGSERLAHALARLAEENASVRRVLNTSLQGSAWLELTIAVACIAIPIGTHHGLIPSTVIRNIPMPLGPEVPDYPPRNGNGDGTDTTP